MDRNRHIAIFLRMLAVNEIRLSRRMFTLLKGQANDMSAAYADSGFALSEQMLNNSIEQITVTLIPTFTSTISEFGGYTAEQLGVTKSTFEIAAGEFIMENGLSAAKEITHTTRKHLKDIVFLGQQEGLGQNQIAKLIREKIIHFSRSRSRMIARTEVHNAATFAQLQTAKESGRQLDKEWVAAEDSRTRLAHSIADGQTVALQDNFLVDNESIARPGEGSAANSIECRCTIVFIPHRISNL